MSVGAMRREKARAFVCALLGVPENVLMVGTACRIAEVKQPLFCAEVFCEVLQRLPECHAVLLGAGDVFLEQQLQDLVQARGLRDRFHLPGYRPDAAQWVAGFDCFVMTSQREGMPGALLEAMAAMTPIAFFEGEGGLVDLAELNAQEGPFAAIVAQGEVQALADRVVGLLQDPAQRVAFAQRAYDVGRRHFNLEDMSARLSAVYQGVLCA